MPNAYKMTVGFCNSFSASDRITQMNNWWEFGESIGYSGDTLSLGRVTCAFCDVKGEFKELSELRKQNKSSGKILYYLTLQCENCGNYIFLIWSTSSFGGRLGLHNFSTLPFPLGEATAPEHWSSDIQRYWRQAHGSLKAENWDAAALMARSALQIIMREQGASGSTLFHEIDSLHKKGVLPQIMKEFANEVRELGNDSAHPKPGDKETTQKDAEDIVKFLDILLDYIYDLPKTINDYRARKSSPSSKST